MRYAYINVHTDQRVLGWFDTEAHNCVLPDPEYLHVCSEADWAFSAQAGDFKLSHGVIVVYEPTEEPVVTSIPTRCTPAQGLVALYILKGIEESAVVAAIEAIPDPVQRYTAKIGYQKATSWERGSQSMALIAALLSLTEEDLDSLFSHAVTINV